MIRTVPVGLGGRAYEVLIGPGLADEAGARIAPLLRRPIAAIVMDETVGDLHGPRLIGALGAAGITPHVVFVPPGEGAKSFAGLERLSDELLALELERGDLIIAFGGGVVGDLAGFAAAIYKRGIDFIQIPTTLLAQVDSSVGGKTAIDTARGKNLIGAFHQPRLVLADLSLLDTLPPREVRCGYGEVLKCALIDSAGFFDWLERHGAAVLARSQAELSEAVWRCVDMKARIVAEDEREGGVRALLNLGHTFGHALEAESGYGEGLKHGEAVALGCAMAFRFSVRLDLCPGRDAERAGALVAAAGLPARLADLKGQAFSAAGLLARMGHDKKARAGSLTFILARGIGEAFVAEGIEAAAVNAFLLAEGARP
ncbi:MAG TPA: 3-dehydroquinate synthase [Caulobacteraceae bacterium]|nr:3-dehydroquinate synthase [Caulobacteraceae bacterium]